MSWFDNTLVLRDFSEAMVKAGAVEDVAVVIQKPYRFTSEYSSWKRAGFPSGDDDEGWAEFIDSFEDEEDDDDEEETE